MEKNQQPGGGAEEGDHGPSGEDEPIRGERLIVKKPMTVGPHVGGFPIGKGGRGQRGGETQRERGPALRQIAVLRLESIIIESVVGVTGDQVGDFVGRHRFFRRGGDGENRMSEGQQHGERDEKTGGESDCGARHVLNLENSAQRNNVFSHLHGRR